MLKGNLNVITRKGRLARDNAEFVYTDGSGLREGGKGPHPNKRGGGEGFGVAEESTRARENAKTRSTLSVPRTEGKR